VTGNEWQPGQLIDIRFTKWGGARHWEFPLGYLGTDEHGVWARGRTGTSLWRPGHGFASEFDWVTLIPDRRPWCASFYDTPLNEIAIYVDMNTEPVWDGNLVTMIDLDLDVVLHSDGSLFVDDEDEFEAHRIELGYPDSLVDLARRTADDVFTLISTGAEPFGSVGYRWLAGLPTETTAP
jgi:hypothetical protein